MEMDKIIAKKWLLACQEKEQSWDGNKYLKPDNSKIFEKSLTKEEKKTGFAQCLLVFGWEWWNDTIDICQRITELKLSHEKLIK